MNKIESGTLVSPTVIRNSSGSRAALRFESEKILSVLKDHENLLMEGFDSCSSNIPIDRVPASNKVCI